jgi:hypothetical protein
MLEGRLARVRGSIKAQEELKEKEARAERVELLRTQFSRRMMYREIAGAWSAWTELWEARSYALHWMRKVVNRMQKKELVQAFDDWIAGCEATHREKDMAEMMQREAALAGATSVLEDQLSSLRGNARARLPSCASCDHLHGSFTFLTASAPYILTCFCACHVPRSGV